MTENSPEPERGDDADYKHSCISCKSPIKANANKCLKCGSSQNWQRHLDVGNTSVSLLIAAISVLALASDNIISLWQNFRDHEIADFSVRISHASPKSVTLVIDNDGPGSVVFDGSMLCEVYQVATEQELFVPDSNDPSRFILSRNPQPNEVVARTVFFYGDEKYAEIFPKGTFKMITLPFREISKQPFAQSDLVGQNEVKSTCSFLFHHENNAPDGIANYITNIDITSFAMDQDAVISAIKVWDDRVERKN